MSFPVPNAPRHPRVPEPLGQTKPKGFLTTRFLRADIFVLVGCWVDTYRPAILCGYYNRSGSASIRIAKDWTPRILQSADVNTATVLCSVAARMSAYSSHKRTSAPIRIFIPARLCACPRRIWSLAPMCKERFFRSMQSRDRSAFPSSMRALHALHRFARSAPSSPRESDDLR